MDHERAFGQTDDDGCHRNGHDDRGVAADGAPKPPPELKVLERFVGTWEYDTLTKASIWNPQEKREQGVEVNEMALDGWYLRGSYRPADAKPNVMHINTYDPKKKTYRTWRHYTGGTSQEWTGQWDEASSTMTLTEDLGDGITLTAVFHIIDNDRREYRVTAKDRDGKVYIDAEGTITRRK